MTPKEVQRILGVSLTRVYSLRDRKIDPLPFQRERARYLIGKVQFKEWLKRNLPRFEYWGFADIHSIKEFLDESD